MDYYAHKTESGEKQTVKQHLENVASLSEKFAIDLIKPLAYATGYGHDIGKYSKAFQNRLNGKPDKFEHSSCGAIEYNKLSKDEKDKIIATMMEYCIAGHHTGLPDGGCSADSAYDDVTLSSKLKRADQYVGLSDYSAYKNEITLKIPQAEKLFDILCTSKSPDELIEKYAFFVRLLFSCLTDADYLDTEIFCKQNTDRTLHSDFVSASEKLNEKLSTFISDTPLKEARSRLQAQAYKNAQGNQHISILNMPTGSGKTLCSLKIALDKVIGSHGSKKRIIYVIPYTSIIEQTAGQFNEIAGNELDILEHHSNYCFDNDKIEPDTLKKLKMASENWDAPLIITTSIQFFESVYKYKSSRLRKLHNMADSVIIFDEIHLLPVKMLQPCLKAIGYITKYMNSEAIFLSATMPDFSQLMKEYIPQCTAKELITDKSDFSYFNKCNYINLGKTDFDNIIEKADRYTSSLIIVNTKRTAREVYKLIQGKKYHLSTNLTPFDRSAIIDKIHKDLNDGVKITVVSTSLVEAGVDFDFEAVFRQLAGLDSILQSGGRCNREGKRKSGDVFIFSTDDLLRGDLLFRADITQNLMKSYKDISFPECIKEYYRRIFTANNDVIKSNSIAELSNGIGSIAFREYADQFEFIKDDTIGIVINNSDECKMLVEKLKAHDYSVKRKLQKYTVSVKINIDFNKAFSLGIVDDFNTGVYILTNEKYYNSDTGLDLDIYDDKICNN